MADWTIDQSVDKALELSSEVMQRIGEKITDIHGSGVDCTWHGELLKNGKVKLTNSFHCMSEHGYYDGYADFSITFNEQDWKLQFHGKYDGYRAAKYMLRDYLEDTFGEAFNSAVWIPVAE